MEGLNGYILLYRKLIKWGWYKDSVVKDLFLHLLLTASYVDFDFMGERYPAGTLITDSQKLADDLGFSRQQIRTALKKLESTKEICVKSTNRFSAVKVHKWGDYQVSKIIEQPTDNQQITNKQPTDNQQITSHLIKKKRKKEINNNTLSLTARTCACAREDGEGLGDYGNVYLSGEEIDALREISKSRWLEYVDRLSQYIKQSGKDYASHYAVIRKWMTEEGM